MYTRWATEPEPMSPEAMTCHQMAAGGPARLTSSPTDATTTTAAAIRMTRRPRGDGPRRDAKNHQTDECGDPRCPGQGKRQRNQGQARGGKPRQTSSIAPSNAGGEQQWNHGGEVSAEYDRA